MTRAPLAPRLLFLFAISSAGAGCSTPADTESDGVDVPRYTGAAVANPSPAQAAGAGNGGSTSPTGSPVNPETTLGDTRPPASQGNGGSNATGGMNTPGGSGGASGAMSSTPPSTPPADPPPAGASAGCAAGGVPANPAVPNTILTLPPAYDGRAPLPLVFAFHGAGRTNDDMRNIDSRTNGGALEDNYVVAYMKSAGNGWDIGADYPRFEAVLDQLLSQLCIDTGSIFAFGHSSGAQFIVQMLGDGRARETRFAGIVPVASSRFNNPSWSPLPTLVIHGLDDNQRNGDRDGALDIVQYTQSNQCGAGTQPLDVPSCPSIANGAAVDPGCVSYAGCAAPTLFCNHDDPNYIQGGTPTNHGWPCFANEQIFQFFESLR